MQNHYVLHIAIFGLSLRILHELKLAIESIIPEDVEVKWTNIADPHLNVLMINEIFLESKNIQRLLQNHKLNVLSLVKTETNIENDILSVNPVDRYFVRHWIIKILYDIKFNTQPLDQQPALTELPIDTPKNFDTSNFIQEFLKPSNGRIRVFDRTGELALCDTSTEWAWTNLASKSTDHSVNFVNATMSDILNDGSKQRSLKAWLWNLLWLSPELNSNVPRLGIYKLRHWPQPEFGVDHRDILKMSACFAKGASIDDVANFLKLPLLTVQKFVAASLAIDFIVETSGHDQIQEVIIQVQPPAVEQKTIKKLFNSLRRRLGL